MNYVVLVIIGTIVLSSIVFISFNSYYTIYRNRKTYAFIKELNKLVSETTQKLIRNGVPENLNKTEKLIEMKNKIHNSLDYKSVVYSNKPIKLSSFFTEKEIEILKQDKI